MTNHSVSTTALVCAFARAYHSLYEKPKVFDDFLAHQLLTPEEFSNISSYMSQGISFFNPEEGHLYQDPQHALEWVIQHQLGPTPLARSQYTEEMLENAILLGAKQYIMLGAGFDTFAFRKPELLNVLDVFEVDHLATQTSKLEHIKTSEWKIPSALHFIPVDFAKDDFSKALLNAPFTPSKISFYSWLGVTYYLTEDIIYKTLKKVAAISPKGSCIVFDYADHDLFTPAKTSFRVQKMVELAKASGEPMQACFKYKEIESLLEKAGFLIYEHLTPSDINMRYFKSRQDAYHAFENIHYITAVLQ